MAEPALHGRRVLVGVGGSVAAFKACDVVTELRRSEADVRVAMTDAATRFVTTTLLRALSGHRVAVDMWDGAAAEAEHGMSHLDLAAWCEVQVVVAASADLIARLALGLAGDVVTATALACRAPLIVAPAMEAAMWEHPATATNAATLTARGARILGPVRGRLASGHEGSGRMVEADVIVAAVEESLGTNAGR
jgi:phosphopantothenoylcysteine decarboxylase / phosphopantothenate---cysteine ligase